MALMASLPKMWKCPFKLCHYERHTLRYNASAPFLLRKSFFYFKNGFKEARQKANLPTKIWTIPSKSQHIHIWGYKFHVLLSVVVKLIARAVSEQLFLNFLWSVATVHKNLNWLFSRSPANLKSSFLVGLTFSESKTVSHNKRLNMSYVRDRFASMK